MRDREEIALIFEKFLEGTCTKEEFDLLKEYLKKPEAETNIKRLMDEDGELIQHYDTLTRDAANKESKQLFNKILQAVGEREALASDHTWQRKSRGIRQYVLASLLIFALVGSLVIYRVNGPSNKESAWMIKETLPGQKLTITLMDGSTVLLNSGSRLIYPKLFGNTREVTLEGEAFFMVSRNEQKPFIIKSGELTTTVLGTSFNIKAFQNENIEVTVATGKVKVSHDNEEAARQVGQSAELVLTPNQQAIYNIADSRLNKEQINAERHLAWREGVLKFDNLRFEEAVKMLERWYGVSITLENRQIGDCIIIGEFQNQSLHKVLRAVELALGIDYEFGSDGVVINGEGC
ncbi:FecR domain-containing protein [Fulvivirgaceae bacterium BMA12]|uniref:FecR domain-containing protein n=1 Tax=Agaribacillus aureus TaxID=3051825 RepID=A0ABT8L4G5_9BACT|nr:FecR domain-containing protein [Fulvivirgaceae bacterium BMA12]